MQTQKCSCLIPFYNEGDRLLYTLEKLSSIKELKEIICIDDGSADNASKLAKEKFPNINVIVLPHNQGKSAAIFKGLLSVTTEYVLLFDADLQEIKVEEIQNAIQGIENHRSVDMIILRRVVERKLLSFLRHDVVMSGQRILRTKDLIEVAKMKPEKYALETAINKYMMKNNKIVYWIPHRLRISLSFLSALFQHEIINFITTLCDCCMDIIRKQPFDVLKLLQSF